MKKTYLTTLALGLILVTRSFAQYAQDPLPYAFNALEPHIDAKTMEIHYSMHHAAYVKNLNNALKEAGRENQLDLKAILADVSNGSMAVRNNAGGHYNHSLFWKILTPDRGTQPSAELSAAIEKSFGSLDAMKSRMNQAASGIFGSGWAWLIVTPGKELAITSTPNQDNPLMDIAPVKGTPLLGIDVWEHAYYLKYQNKRGDYLQAIWNVINWKAVSDLYAEASRH